MSHPSRDIRNRYTPAIEAAGYRLLHKTSRHHVYAKGAEAQPPYLYVGRRGSVRVGRSLAESVSVSNGRKQVWLSTALSLEKNRVPKNPTAR